MARSVALSVLRDRVLQRADLEGCVGTGQKYSQAEEDDAINESLCETYDIIRSARGNNYFRTSATIATVGGTRLYDLPGDFLEAISVDVTFGPGAVFTATEYVESERNMFQGYPGPWPYGQPLFFQLQGEQLSFIPTPSGVFTATLNYVPVMPPLIDPTDTFPGIGGWEEHGVLGAAIKLLLKDGDAEMISVLAGLRDGEERRIRAALTRTAQPARPQDVYASGPGRGFFPWGD